MAMNMTQGPVMGPLVRFTVPLVLGNIFQLTYNAADSVMVGRLVGTDALAAVGVAGPVMNIMTFLVVGACLGAGVLMSEFYGAGEERVLRREVGTTLTAGLAFTLLLSLLCGVFSPALLRLTRVEEALLPQATVYLRIICVALSFTFLYNLFAAALRAVGDSRTPLVFLIFSSVLNVGANYLMMGVFRFGVLGAALATALAEGISALLCAGYVFWRIPLLRLKRGDLRVEKTLLRRTLGYSAATAMQQTALHVGKLLVQSCINGLGVAAIAAFNAVNRIDDFAYTPQQNIGNGMATFIAQNRGAGRTERIKKGFWAGGRLEAGYFVLLCTAVYLGAQGIMELFVTDSPEVVAMGTQYLRWMALFYIMPMCTNWIQGYFRGMGNMKMTAMSTSVQMVGRVIFTFLLAPRYGIVGVAFAQLGGWVVMLAYEVPYLIRALKETR